MRRGFTLVELSIVLVIIGLLIGGILVAQSMILTTRIQRQIRDLAQYEAAVNNFTTNYKYYPGDDPYFVPPGAANESLLRGAGGAGFCNGIYTNVMGLQSWSHMAQAGMISGNYQPYAPSSPCGGPMADSQQDMSVIGVIGPYTELDSAAARIFGQNRRLITVGKDTADSHFSFSMILSASYVLPLETKLGVAAVNDPTTVVGLSNLLTPGKCEGPGNTHIPCSDPNAQYGSLWYYLPPK